MPRKCEKCDKTSTLVTIIKKLRGKYNPTTKKRRYPNLQWAVIDGARAKVCTQCIRTSRKVAK